MTEQAAYVIVVVNNVCPICGTECEKRVGNVIGGEWRYCWLCECGHCWDWVSQGADEGNMLLNEWLDEEEQERGA